MINEHYILIGLIVVFVLQNVVLLIKRARPNGLLHIDEYLNKDAYRMIYFTPLEDLKKCRVLVLRVEVQKWQEEMIDYDKERFQ